MALWFYALVLTGWLASASVRDFVHLYAYLDNLLPRKLRNTTMTTSRPRPLRVAASIVGGLTALVSGLVGSGLLTGGQGDAVTGIITAVITLLAAFGITLTAEPKVTPLADPRDHHGRLLITSTDSEAA
ncbi:hypothetical protein JOF56_005700 [Kibdelosporangium banguiense]|uniref:Uncharacterized protein n=1 Tax=Kibdelosporangium banguiense TaxID=1365924 RepID=A0ABS4TLN5_9PSEU|nr:hypothetical protein [Kibdelosporangium banguiense]MBP2325315.1 hypothetical protein [Kibdelosporangium banguiense]